MHTHPHTHAHTLPPSPPTHTHPSHVHTDINMTFPCTERVEGTVTITVLFYISRSISTRQDLNSLPGTEIRLRGRKHCNRTVDDSGGNDSGGFNASVFYIAIGCVGGLIAVVVMVTVLYHCIMLGTWMNKHREDTEE